ncbi:MAG TPA: hypothetical protein VGM62_02175 [Chthoniobacterales bacterium]|jgi:hypothetical protein
MPSTESVAHQDLILCACADREYKTRDVIDAALWRGDSKPSWDRFLLRLEAEKKADELEMDLDDDELDAAAETFRYERDLITAEETEQWLAARGLNLDDFSDYFGRQSWGTKLENEVEIPEMPYVTTPENLRQLFAADLILSGELDELTTQLMWRLAAGCAEAEPDPTKISALENEFFENHQIDPATLPDWLSGLGRDAEWFKQMLEVEAAYQRRCESALLPNALKHEVASLRLPLTRIEAEVLELESQDAAREAMFCVTEDGMSMEEVAAEGRYPYRQINFLLEDLSAELQQMFTSVSEGELVDPMPHGDGFELCRVTKKIEPNSEDAAVKQRVEQRLLQRHFGELCGKHVERRLGAIIASE